MRPRPSLVADCCRCRWVVFFVLFCFCVKTAIHVQQGLRTGRHPVIVPRRFESVSVHATNRTMGGAHHSHCLSRVMLLYTACLLNNNYWMLDSERSSSTRATAVRVIVRRLLEKCAEWTRRIQNCGPGVSTLGAVIWRARGHLESGVVCAEIENPSRCTLGRQPPLPSATWPYLFLGCPGKHTRPLDVVVYTFLTSRGCHPREIRPRPAYQAPGTAPPLGG